MRYFLPSEIIYILIKTLGGKEYSNTWKGEMIKNVKKRGRARHLPNSRQ
jgi:hypothetical protein